MVRSIGVPAKGGKLALMSALKGYVEKKIGGKKYYCRSKVYYSLEIFYKALVVADKINKQNNFS